MIKQRRDVNFLICAKRIERVKDCLPDDWCDGYENVILAVTCENQIKTNERLTIFKNLKIKHKYIFIAPVLEDIDLSVFLKTKEFELVSFSGESYENARICDFSWIKHIKECCDKY